MIIKVKNLAFTLIIGSIVLIISTHLERYGITMLVFFVALLIATIVITIVDKPSKAK